MSDTRITRDSDDRTPLALAAGLLAALLGGSVWAAIVLVTDYEIGWVAWGIGALVGLAMAKVTRTRSRPLAVGAAVLALVGLVAGKGFVTAGSAGSIADELAATPEYLAAPVAWQMYETGELDAETLEAVRATEEAGDTLSDALWEAMVTQATARVAAMSEADRRAIADAAAAGYVNQLGLVDGILVQLSGFDLLWLVLAVGTAFQIMDARDGQEPEVALEPAANEDEPIA